MEATRPATAAFLTLFVVACGGAPASPEGPAVTLERRPATVRIGGDIVLEGVAYGPHREGQSPDEAQPSDAELLEDLLILAEHWRMIRVYGSGDTTARILRIAEERDLPLKVLLGAWVAPERDSAGDPIEGRRAANDREVANAIRLANEYPERVFAVSIGNETQVYWSAHRSSRERLIELIRRARTGVRQPVTTADDYNFWNRPESQAVAREIDFLLLHAYAMWNRQTLADAVPWTAARLEEIRGHHPELPIVLGETGWATDMHPSGDARRQIVGAAGEAEQATFHRELTAWAREAELPHFFFEAFDEPWKGGPHPTGVEKHWGLFREDRTPKAAMAPEGVAEVTP